MQVTSGCFFNLPDMAGLNCFIVSKELELTFFGQIQFSCVSFGECLCTAEIQRRAPTSPSPPEIAPGRPGRPGASAAVAVAVNTSKRTHCCLCSKKTRQEAPAATVVYLFVVRGRPVLFAGDVCQNNSTFSIYVPYWV